MEINRIKECRQRAGISQVKLARRARIAPQNLSSIERGKLVAWPRAKRAIARALRMSEAELFDEVN